MEDLVGMADDITGAGEVLLRDRAGEEISADKEKQYLVRVVPSSVFLTAPQVTHNHPVSNRTDIQDERQPSWDHLAHLPHDGVRPLVPIFCVAAASTRQPATESSCWQEEKPELVIPGLVRAVVEMGQGATILVDADTNVVHEVEGVVVQLRFGLQEVGQEAAGQVGDRGEDKDEQRQGPRVHR